MDPSEILLSMRQRRPAQQLPSYELCFRVCSDGSEVGLGPAGDDESESEAGPSRAARTFPRFADLPAELRLQIWAEAIRPRVVAVWCRRRGRGRADPELPTPFPALHTGSARETQETRRQPRAIPPLLHTSRESRAVALERYTLSFPWRVPFALLSAGPGTGATFRSSGPDGASRQQRPARTWFDFERDALLLTGDLEPRGEEEGWDGDRDDYSGGSVSAPLAYFLGRGDAARVRRVVCHLGRLMAASSPSAGEGGGEGGEGEGGSLYVPGWENWRSPGTTGTPSTSSSSSTAVPVARPLGGGSSKNSSRKTLLRNMGPVASWHLFRELFFILDRFPRVGAHGDGRLLIVVDESEGGDGELEGGTEAEGEGEGGGENPVQAFWRRWAGGVRGDEAAGLPISLVPEQDLFRVVAG